MTTDLTEDFGVFSFDGKAFDFNSGFYPSWYVPFDDLRLIGEFTNQDGPHISDHFFLFIDLNQNCYETPVGAEGFDSTWKQLADMVGISAELSLLGSTDFASEVLWPQNLRGCPIFEYIEQPRRSLLGRMFRCFGIVEIESKLTDAVRDSIRDEVTPKNRTRS